MSKLDQPANAADDYDSPWKDAVECCFPEFMAFFFPDVYSRIDWLSGYDFLDQELQVVVQDAQLGCRLVDKLVRVRLIDGDEAWIDLHIEIQDSRQAEFAERIFVYNCRLSNRYRRPVISLALLADDDRAWRPKEMLKKSSRAGEGQGARSAGCETYQADRRASEHRPTQPFARAVDLFSVSLTSSVGRCLAVALASVFRWSNCLIGLGVKPNCSTTPTPLRWLHWPIFNKQNVIFDDLPLLH